MDVRDALGSLSKWIKRNNGWKEIHFIYSFIKFWIHIERSGCGTSKAAYALHMTQRDIFTVLAFTLLQQIMNKEQVMTYFLLQIATSVFILRESILK
jgi:hypothetical protein